MLSLSFGLPPSRALAAARRRGVMLSPDFYDLPPEYRRLAFTVSGLAALEQIQDVRDSLASALRDGKTFADWRREFPASDLTLPRARLDLIFRQHAQTAYMAGHHRTMVANAERRPFWMYSSINDNRTRATHRAMNGFIARWDDPVWERWFPPCGFNCRCTVIALTEAQARARGGPSARPPVEPDPGFGGLPTDSGRNLERLLRERVTGAGGGPFVAAYERALEAMLRPDWLSDEWLAAGRAHLAERMAADPRLAAVTPAEAAAALYYTRSGYSVLNRHLRGPAAAGDSAYVAELSEQQVGFVQAIASLVRKLEDGAARTIYRAIAVTEGHFERLRAALRPGEVVETSAFFSASVDRGTATAHVRRQGQILFVVETRRGANIGSLSHAPTEAEILVAPGARFRVVRATLSEDGDSLVVELADVARGTASIGLAA